MKRQPPRYWWDFVHEGDDMHVIVETDDVKAPGVLMRWPADEMLGDMCYAVIWAERLIAKLKAGQVSPEKVRKTEPNEANKTGWPNL